jgi:hypothetical protein
MYGTDPVRIFGSNMVLIRIEDTDTAHLYHWRKLLPALDPVQGEFSRNSAE